MAGPNSIESYFSALRYRWKVAVAVGLMVAGITAYVVWHLPAYYSATTTILVDPQKVPDKYVSTTVTEEPNERLNTVTQEVLSRTRLSEIVDRFHLYPEMNARLGRNRVLEYMRSQIQIQVKKTNGASLSAFSISYRSNDRGIVALVVNQLAKGFIDWNLEQRQALVEGTTKFLGDELVQARNGLQEQEAKLRDYRLQHLGQMPEQMPSNLQTLSRLQAERQSRADSLNRLDQERLAVMQDPTGSSTGNSAYVSPHARMRAQVAEARKQLTDLRARYTSQHPDVLAAQDYLRDLESQLEQTPVDSSAAPQQTFGSGSEAPNRLRLLDRQKMQFLEQQAQIDQQIRHYQQMVDVVPVREAEVSGLLRDYESAKENYRSLLEKSYSAEMATELEKKQQGERFQVLDPAIPPDHTESPNRSLLLLGALLLGILAGIGVALLMEFLDTSIKTEAELSALLPRHAKLLGHIPNIKPVAAQ